MRSKVLKWGNSLAFRIPKTYAEDIGLKKDSPIEIKKTKYRIILISVAHEKYTLESMLAKINEDNLHHEVEAGSPMGNEVW